MNAGKKIMAALSLMLVLTAMAAVFTPSEVSGQKSIPAAPVQIVSPLPVPTAAQGTTNVAGTVSAAQSGAWNVSLSGVPVVTLATTPVESTGAVQCGPAGSIPSYLNCTELPIYTVPTNTRLVIRHITIIAPCDSSPGAFMTLTTKMNGADESHFLPISSRTDTLCTDLSGGYSFPYTSSLPVTFYSEAGSSVRLNAHGPGPLSVHMGITVSVSGELIPVLP